MDNLKQLYKLIDKIEAFYKSGNQHTEDNWIALGELKDKRDKLIESITTYDLELAKKIVTHIKKVECDEDAHADIDGIFCTILKQLGYGEIVEIYGTITKYYA